MAKRARDDEDGTPPKVPRIEVVPEDLHWLRLLPTEMRETIWDFLPFRAHLHLSVCCTWLSGDLTKRVVVPRGWRCANLDSTMGLRMSLYRCINRARDLGIHLWPGVETLYTCAYCTSHDTVAAFKLRSHRDPERSTYRVEILFADRPEHHMAEIIVPAPFDASHIQFFSRVYNEMPPIGDALSYLRDLALQRSMEVTNKE